MNGTAISQHDDDEIELYAKAVSDDLQAADAGRLHAYGEARK